MKAQETENEKSDFSYTRWGVFSPEERSELMIAMEQRRRLAEERTGDGIYVRRHILDPMADSLASYLGDTPSPE